MGTVKTCRLCLSVHQPGECLARPCNAGYLYIAPKPKLVEPMPEPPVIAEPEPQPEQPEQPQAGTLIWVEAPDGYEHGRVVFVKSNGLIVIYADDCQLSGHMKNAFLSGGHRCLLTVGKPVIFKRYDDPEHGTIAVNIYLNEEVSAPEVETSVVAELHDSWLLAKRLACGCPIMIPGREFKDKPQPYEGMRVEHRHLEDSDGRLHGTAVKILAPAA
jgi:hypothetical protein